jgi:hypothetical protein
MANVEEHRPLQTRVALLIVDAQVGLVELMAAEVERSVLPRIKTLLAKARAFGHARDLYSGMMAQRDIRWRPRAGKFTRFLKLMRQVAEFVAVLACSLFTGAAVYLSLVEHPARMECGVEIATAEFPPSYPHASDVGSRVPAVFYCSMACRGNILVGRCRSLAGFGHPLHTDCHPADQ